MSSGEPQTANLTLEALVKQHNVLVHLVMENISLTDRLNKAVEYISRLEAVVEAAQDGSKETEPVREVEQEINATG